MSILFKLSRLLLVSVVFAGTTLLHIEDCPAAEEEGEGPDVSMEAGDTAGTSGDEAGPAPERSKKKEHTLWEIIKLGGPLMYVLAFLSFMTIVLITFYFLSLTPANSMPPLFAQKLQEMLSARRLEEAGMFCKQHDNTLSRILRKGFVNQQRGREAIITAMRGEGERQASGLWRKISYLSDIAVVAPMVGLLGTTVGMLYTFRAMGAGRSIGGFSPENLAGGIFQAMVTTVAGLIIAIIATSFYAYFRGVVERIVIGLEEATSQYAELVEEGHKK